MDNVIIYDKLEELNEGIEYNGRGINGLKQDTAVLKSDTAILKNKGVVKSVQRGQVNQTVNVVGDTSSYTFTINLSAFDMNKALFLHDFSASGGYSVGLVRVASVSLSQTNMQVKVIYETRVDSTITLTGEWQVIEFY